MHINPYGDLHQLWRAEWADKIMSTITKESGWENYPEFSRLDSTEVYHKYPKTMDTFNCEVYMLYAIDRLGAGISFEQSLNPTLYRIQTAKTLLSFTNNQSCQFCFNTKNKNYLNCLQCNCIAHVTCAKIAKKNSYTFECFICSKLEDL